MKCARRLTSILMFTALGDVSLAIFATQAQEPFPRGIGLEGKLTFKPIDDQALGKIMEFTISATSGEMLLIKIRDSRLQQRESVGGRWGELLSPSDFAKVHFVSAFFQEDGIPLGHPETIVRCFPSALGRNETFSSFGLTCLPDDVDSAERRNGQMMSELSVGIVARVGSEFDTFF